MREEERKKYVFFEKKIRDFSQKAGREHLPWRKKNITAYEVWVSEIMLQQTQVNRVVEYYTRFLTRFPDVQSLALARWETFLPYYAGLGYYVRGKNMLRTAKEVMEKYQGVFPRDKASLVSLPGIGHYTASAILSFAYNENHLAWDTNLYRVIGRFFFGGKHLVKDTASFESLFRSSKKILNGALMDFGSSICVARPKCEACMLQTKCLYYQEQGKQEQNIKARKSVGTQKSQKKVDWTKASVCVFLHEKHIHYYSARKNRYEPFILASGYNTRAGIKKYFLEKYALTLSVRPPYKKEIIKGKPIFFVNAQILLGESHFAVFPKSAREVYTIFNSIR